MLDTVVMSGDDVCCSVVFGTLVGMFVFSVVMWSELLMTSAITQQTVGKETIAFGLYFASVFPSSDILNGYVTNTEANNHVALSSHRNSQLYITFFHVL